MAEKQGKGGFGLLLLIVVVVVVNGGGTYDWVDEQGWISHSSTASITYPSHGWEVGEYLNCIGMKVGDAVTLDCSRTLFETGTVREMGTTIHGKLTKDGANLRCQRNTDSISCDFASALPSTPPIKPSTP